MEEKINIAEILKDKPQGTKLYDWLHNIDVELDTIITTDTETVVWCTNETNNNTTCHRGYSEFGTERGYPDGFDSYWLDKMGLLQEGDTWHSALGSTKIAITLGNILYVHQLQHLIFGLGLNSEMEV